MIPVFVISLADSIDRRNSITKHLNTLGILFEFVDAVDGRKGLPTEYENQIDRRESLRRGRKLSDAEFACALSHIKVYQKIVSSNIPWALILEDDAFPHFDLVPYLENRCFEDAQLTQLIYGMPIFVRRKGRKFIFGKFRSYICSSAKVPRLAIGYVISKYAAKYLLDHGTPVTNTADWPNCISKLIKNKNFRIVHPPLIHHADMQESIIDQYGRNEERKSKRRFLGIYIPPKQGIIDTLIRSPHKLFSKRINSHDI